LVQPHVRPKDNHTHAVCLVSALTVSLISVISLLDRANGIDVLRTGLMFFFLVLPLLLSSEVYVLDLCKKGKVAAGDAIRKKAPKRPTNIVNDGLSSESTRRVTAGLFASAKDDARRQNAQFDTEQVHQMDKLAVLIDKRRADLGMVYNPDLPDSASPSNSGTRSLWTPSGEIRTHTPQPQDSPPYHQETKFRDSPMQYHLEAPQGPHHHHRKHRHHNDPSEDRHHDQFASVFPSDRPQSVGSAITAREVNVNNGAWN
jgi:hypothetical protein